jgi:hypothetical protein
VLHPERSEGVQAEPFEYGLAAMAYVFEQVTGVLG